MENKPYLTTPILSYSAFCAQELVLVCPCLCFMVPFLPTYRNVVRYWIRCLLSEVWIWMWNLGPIDHSEVLFPTETSLCSCSCKSQKEKAEKQKKRVTMHWGNWTGSCVVIVIGPPCCHLSHWKKAPVQLHTCMTWQTGELNCKVGYNITRRCGD